MADPESPAALEDETTASQAGDSGGEGDDGKSDDEIIIDSPSPDRRKIWLRRGILIGIGVFVIVVIVLAVSLGRSEGEGGGKDPDVLRYDCQPDHVTGTEEAVRKDCQTRGCTWNSKSDIKCAYPRDYKNYDVLTISPISQNRILIKLNKTSRSSGFTNDVSIVAVDVTGIDESVIRVKVYDDGASRWEVPLPKLNLDHKSDPHRLNQYNITASGNILSIRRRETNAIVFQTDLSKLVFADQFLQITVDVASKSLYGFGERQGPHEKSVRGATVNERKRFTFLNHDGVDWVSSYGSHPFYLMYEARDRDEAHGVLLLNSNAMDITYTTAPALTYRSIGGVLDFLIFTGPTGKSVLRQKSRVIGHASLPPYWSLGFHLCRYGYQNDSQVRDAFMNNTMRGIPVDAQWVDIDYMDRFNGFTIDRENFGKLEHFVRHLHSNGRKFVPILDPGLAYEINDTLQTPEYMSGLENDVFIRDEDREILVTRVWNERTVLPDFTHPNAGAWWRESLGHLHANLSFDGLWLDMNEPATIDFYGSVKNCTNDSLDEPQYNPVQPNKLWDRTICFSARQNLSRHYNLHNLYSLYESRVTYESLQEMHPHRRPFILSRGTTTGQGRYSAHWLGDVHSSWDHMRASIPGILDFNLFGIPFVGSDICGFVGNTTDELCSRWTSLGSFYPFSRNHNEDHARNQDPASMGLNVQEAARKSLNTRYTLLPYLYTLFYHASVQGDPVARSLKLNFPQDERTNSIDRQFMWGDGILINPVLDEGATSVSAYFPAGLWYDYYTGHVLSNGTDGENKTLSVPLTDISVALRGGRIIPTIPSVNKTTHDHKSMPFEVIAALDGDQSASGDLYWDDGELVDAASNSDLHTHITFRVKNSHLVVNVPAGGYRLGNFVTEIKVWGVRKEVEKVVLVKNHADASGDAVSRNIPLIHTYVNGRLRAFLPPGTSLSSSFTIRWSY